ncbi:MAG: asparagine synthetase B [Promethearchaeota archaeon CR_4]|nr:MAG: asparagine synthetase B [Candidatus Lokiarchaeota archaeon CR_4]
MAGILSIISEKGEIQSCEIPIAECSSLLQHRGEKEHFTLNYSDVILVIYGNQKDLFPNVIYMDKKTGAFLALDGQIYNGEFLKQKYKLTTRNPIIPFKNNYAEILLRGYLINKIDFFKDVIGSFSGILWDGEQLVGFKDPVGAKPLYYCQKPHFIAYASELKVLAPLRGPILPIDPGTLRFSKEGQVKYFDFKIPPPSAVKPEPEDSYAKQVNFLIRKAVLDNIRPSEKVAALLSGGIDSTIVTSIAKDRVKDLHVYSIGVEGSRDLHFAESYAQEHNLLHTVVKIAIEDLLAVIPSVVTTLETFDAALIRSAVPMFILSKRIHEEENPDVLLTGEGGDELFGGYDYLKDLKNPESFNQELINLLEIEHKTGLQRVDRIPYHFSIEARAPLFDQRLVDFALQIPPDLKIKEINNKKIEKYILRKAFETELPREIVWREKEKFSKGVGSQFLLRDHFQGVISDMEFDSERHITPFLHLRSKEELHYWRIFEATFHPVRETIANIGLTSTYEV